MSNLVAHAESELRRAGWFDADSDYAGMVGPAVLKMVEQFADEGHSGMSAHLTLFLFGKVAAWKPLGPITDSPDEWMDVSDNTWQNRRAPSLFSNDAGKTYYDLDERVPRWWVPRLFGRYKKIRQSVPADV